MTPEACAASRIAQMAAWRTSGSARAAARAQRSSSLTRRSRAGRKPRGRAGRQPQSPKIGHDLYESLRVHNE